MIGHVLVTAAKDHDIAGSLGYLFGTLLVPGIGLLLLIQGLRQRRSSRRQVAEPVAPDYQGLPVPPSPTIKSGGSALIVVGAAVMVASLVTVAASALNIDDSTLVPHQLAIGQCVTDKDYRAKNIDNASVACQRVDAVYELASKGDGSAPCPDGKRDDTDYVALTNDRFTYCFALNLREGACYHVEDQKHIITPVACTSEDATVRIDRRIDGSTDITQCDTGTKGLSLPVPPRVYCVVAAEPGTSAQT
jgi:hypothetical protein